MNGNSKANSVYCVHFMIFVCLPDEALSLAEALNIFRCAFTDKLPTQDYTSHYLVFVLIDQSEPESSVTARHQTVREVIGDGIQQFIGHKVEVVGTLSGGNCANLLENS